MAAFRSLEFRCLHVSVAGVKMLKPVPASAEWRVQCCSPRNTVDIRNPGGQTVKAAVHSQEKFPEKIETHSNTRLFVLFVYVHSMPGGGVHED